MKLKSVQIENYRAIEHLRLELDPSHTVLHGDNTCGKTSVLSAIAVGLGAIPPVFDVSGPDFLETDLRAGESFVQVDLTTTEGGSWKRERRDGATTDMRLGAGLTERLSEVTRADEEDRSPVELPIVASGGWRKAIPTWALSPAISVHASRRLAHLAEHLSPSAWALRILRGAPDRERPASRAPRASKRSPAGHGARARRPQPDGVLQGWHGPQRRP